MKLVELLAEKIKEWPEGAKNITQDHDGSVNPCTDPHNDIEFDGSRWSSTNGFHMDLDIIGKQDLSSDYKTAIVTRPQWQAERDRQKGGEWKRHRGGKCPIHGDQMVEVKLRDGDIQQAYARCFAWPYDSCDTYANIMQYRIISQPQAEEVEVKDTNIGTISHKISVDQIAGPLAWRDTIIHCQAIIEDCEREIQRNVDLLDAEGLMMQTDSKKAIQHYAPDVDMNDWRNWEIGDHLKIFAEEEGHEFEICQTVKVIGFTRDDESLPVKAESLDGDEYWFINDREAKFIRRQ